MLRHIGQALDKRPLLKNAGFRFLLPALLLVPLAGCGAPSRHGASSLTVSIRYGPTAVFKRRRNSNDTSIAPYIS
jgi:hypothetical protein